MKRMTAVVILSILSGFLLVKKMSLAKTAPIAQSKKQPSFSVHLFIPYWQDFPTNSPTLRAHPPEIPALHAVNETRYLYFGITPDKKGINTQEEGYKKLKKLTSLGKNAHIVLRMTKSDLVEQILSDEKLQNTIADQTVNIAQDKGFSGVLLDLEITALPIEKLIRQITAFTATLSQRIKSHHLTFNMILYGDQFYRKRPYDVVRLNRYVDQFFVMAYDLHKSFGDPGPNFPLQKGDRYPYDLHQATDEFISFVPSEKLTIIFGMYGYDWTVDEKKRPIKKASSISLADIRKKFLNNCSWKNCLIKRDPLSQESEIDYVDLQTSYHIVWFEDEQSVERKIDFLTTKGIVNFAFWVYGYY